MAKGARLPLLLPILPVAASLGQGSRAIVHPAPSFTSCACLCNYSGRRRRESQVGLHARRNDRRRTNGGPRRKKSSGKEKNAAAPDEYENAPIEISSATQRLPASLAGVVEDHRYEQFFYDEATANQLYQLVDLYERPLLLCNPTLAVMADRKGRPYRLLDRDTRFSFLSGYEPFSLMEPHLITDYDFDAVFIDPPFANVTPEQVARCLRLMSADKVPLWVAYNSRREKKLLEALNALDCPDLEPKWGLSYKEGVSVNTQDSIWLYGPKDGH